MPAYPPLSSPDFAGIRGLFILLSRPCRPAEADNASPPSGCKAAIAVLSLVRLAPSAFRRAVHRSAAACGSEFHCMRTC